MLATLIQLCSITATLVMMLAQHTLQKTCICVLPVQNFGWRTELIHVAYGKPSIADMTTLPLVMCRLEKLQRFHWPRADFRS